MSVHMTAEVHHRAFRWRIGRVPAALGGLALAIVSIAGSWGLFLPAQAALFKIVLTPISLALVTLVLLKYLFNPGLIHEDLQHHVVSSVMPTLAMTLMVIGGNIYEWMPELGRSIWIFAVAAHIVLFIGFVVYRCRDFHINNMVPSWFVPPIGIVVACVSGSAMGFPELTAWLFTFGVAVYGVMLPIMFYRLIFHDRLPEAANPTFGIMAAPASLTLAGYLTISADPNIFIVAALTPIAILMTTMVWVALVKLLRQPFAPGFAAFTFPMVISATALLKLEQLLTGTLGNTLPSYPQACLYGMATLELAVATGVVSYVGWCFFQHYVLKRR